MIIKTKGFLFIISIVFFGICNLKAETENIAGGIVLNVIVPSQGTYFSDQVKQVLKSKLESMAANNGLSGNMVYPNFLLVPKIIVTAYQTTPTAPPKTLVKLDIVLKIADAKKGEIFETYTLNTAGISLNKRGAYFNAIQQLRTNAPGLTDFFKKGKEKIISYYKNKCDNLIKKAETMVSVKKYRQALSILSSIPNATEFCYEKSSKKINEVYSAYMNHQCEEILRKANVAVSNGEYKKARNMLACIPSDIKCYSKVKNMRYKISNRICNGNLSKAKVEMKKKNFNSVINYLSRISKNSSCGIEADKIWNQISKERNDMYIQKAKAAKAKGDLDKAAEYASEIPTNSEYAQDAENIIKNLETERQEKYKEKMAMKNKEMDYKHQRELSADKTALQYEKFKNQVILEAIMEYTNSESAKSQAQKAAYELVK